MAMAVARGIGGQVAGLEGVQLKKSNRLALTMYSLVVDAIQVICRLYLVGSIVAVAVSQATDAGCDRCSGSRVSSQLAMMPVQSIVQPTDTLELSCQCGWQLRITIV